MASLYEWCEDGCDDTALDFDDGVIDFWAYSYHIDSTGSGHLDKAETRKLYEAMKQYFEGEDHV